MTATPELSDDEKHLASLGYKQELQPLLVRLLELRHLVLDHLDPGRLFHLVRPRLEQRWPGGDRLGLADRLGVHPDHRAVHVRAGLGLPDVRRDLLVGQQTRRPEGRVLHRLAEPDRADRHRRVGRLRLRDVPRPDARAPSARAGPTGYSLTRVFIMFLVDPGDCRRRQHLLQPPAGRSSTTSRCGGTWSAPRPSSSSCSWFRTTTPASRDVFAQTINNSGMFDGATSGAGFLFFVLPISAILTQYTITGYDASAHLSEETKSAAGAAAKGIWRSIFYSAIGGWILLLAFLFAVQDPDRGVGQRRRRVHDLHPVHELRLGRHRADHLHRRPVLLHDGLHDEFVPDAVRVQPGPRRSRLEAVVDAEQEPGAGERRHPVRRHRRADHPAGPGRRC